MTPPTTTDLPALRPLPASARGQRTRAALLAASTEVFLRDGYAETTTTAITAAARVGYGTFYVYFASKEEVFLEVVRELMEHIYRGSRAPQEQLDPVQRLLQENALYFALYRDNAQLIERLHDAARIELGIRDAWLTLRHDYFGKLARSLSRLQAEGRMNPDLDPRYVAECLGAMAERTAYLSTVDPDLDVVRLESTVSLIWLTTLGLTPGTGPELGEAHPLTKET